MAETTVKPVEVYDPCAKCGKSGFGCAANCDALWAAIQERKKAQEVEYFQRHPALPVGMSNAPSHCGVKMDFFLEEPGDRTPHWKCRICKERSDARYVGSFR
jgi:hypothetical protein